MGCMLVCIATTVIGVDYGWERAEDGEYVYVIQIEPHLFDAIKRGEETVESVINPEARHVQRFRVICGDGPLPKDPPPPPPEPPDVKPPDGTANVEKPTENPGAPSAKEPSGSPSDQGEKKDDTSPPNKNAKEPQSSPESQGPELHIWLAWGIAGGCLFAFLYLLMIHIDTRRRYRKLVAQWFADHDEPQWSITQTDSPSEP